MPQTSPTCIILILLATQVANTYLMWNSNLKHNSNKMMTGKSSKKTKIWKW